MPTTYDDYLGLAKPAQGDVSWTTEINENWDTVGLAGTPEATYFVSPTFTDAALFPDGVPTKQRHFNTIQKAIDAGEADAWLDPGYTIKVGPGEYGEQLTIGRPVSIIGPGPSYFDNPAGAARVRGDGNATATIVINPWDANVQKVGLFGLSLDNKYATTNAVEITAAPYLIHIADKDPGWAWGAAANRVDIRGCSMACQTFGIDNSWEAAVLGVGWWDIRLVDCQALGLTYSGNTDSGYFRYLFDIIGDAAARKIRLAAVRSDFHNFTPGAGSPPTLRTFYERGNAQVHLSFCRVLQVSAEAKDETGAANYTEGFAFDTPDDAANFNAFGQNFAIR